MEHADESLVAFALDHQMQAVSPELIDTAMFTLATACTPNLHDFHPKEKPDLTLHFSFSVQREQRDGGSVHTYFALVRAVAGPLAAARTGLCSAAAVPARHLAHDCVAV